jgi:Trypsin/F5/8 type C domain
MRAITRGLMVLGTAITLAVPAGVAAAGVNTTDSVDPHIVGGQNATESYPFMTLLMSSDGWGCGAVLIRPTWVLSARHCTTGANDQPSTPASLSFRTGSLHHDSGGTIAYAKRVIRNNDGADTALIELTAPVPYQPIDIAASAPAGSAIRIIGWGCTTDPGCNGAEFLQQLDTSILADSACGGNQYVLCVNNPDGWRGACYGDSGGPALLRAGTGWVLVGDTSGGTSAVCGQAPSVYAELPTVRSWIESYAGPESGGTPGPGPNLALNKPASSAQASCNSNETPPKAVNGSVGGGNSDKWCSLVSGAKSLTVDLGSSQKISSFVVQHAGAGNEPSTYNTKNFTISVSTDGVGWTTPVTVTNNSSSATVHPVSVTAHYIRLTTTDPVARIYEFEAH